MSAITGICDLRAISLSASASSWDGHATRTMSQPDAVSSAICCSVALTSAVTVVVIDCTEIGWSLPTPTLPTMSCRVGRRGARTGGGAAGIPSMMESVTTPIVLLADSDLLTDPDRIHQICCHCEQDHGSAEEDDHHGDRGQLCVVDRPARRLAAQLAQPVPDPFVEHHRDVPAVQRQQRQQVEHPDEEVQAGQQQEEQL